jgi:hypothetical protein
VRNLKESVISELRAYAEKKGEMRLKGEVAE